MTTPAPLTKQQLRDRRHQDLPEQEAPPTDDEIRRQLGVDLISAERQAHAERDERN